MRIFAPFNQTQAGLDAEFFSPCIHPSFERLDARLRTPTDGQWLGAGYIDIIVERCRCALDIFRQGGGPIIYSDVDVLFSTSLTAEKALESLGDADIAWMQEFPDQPLPNGGFFIGRPEPLVRLFEIMIPGMIAEGIHDQAWLHRHPPDFIKWKTLPPSLFSAKTNKGLGWESYCFHANQTCKKSMETKRALLRAAGSKLATHLTVASYKEDLGWARGIAYPCSIYNAGGRPEFRQVRNIGREAGQWVRSILDRWETLYPCEAFLQGNPTEHFRDLWNDLESGTQFGKRWHPLGSRVLPIGVTKNGRTPWDHEHDRWARETAQKILGGLQDGSWVCGAQFATTAGAIRARGRKFWETLLQYIEEDARAPWALERLWGILL